MKELTIEQKAQRYDEAIERANELNYVSDKDSLQRKTVEHIFPELAESEDDKIKKELLENLRELLEMYNTLQTAKEYRKVQSWIAWLEKQGEKKPIKEHDVCTFCEDRHGCVNPCPMKLIEKEKPADKLEPKFHEGDWIVFNGLTLQVKRVEGGYYITASKDGIPNSYDWGIDNAARLWTIQEAKDGDVLATDKYYENISIFKENHYNIENGLGFLFVHCTYDCNNHHLYPMLLASQEKNYHPATKEQHDILFKKMKEKGYKWDFEKKELKKIEQKPDDKYEPKFKAGDKVLADGKVYTIKLVNEDNYIVDENGKDVQEHFSHTKDWKLYEQNPWSEEDELHIRELESLVKRVWAIAEHENDKETIHKMSDLSFFLKTLKPQPRQEWSEEDEKVAKWVIDYIGNCPNESFDFYGGVGKEAVLSWLNKLKGVLQLQPKQDSTDRFFEGFKKGEQSVIENYGKYGLCKPIDKVEPKWKPTDKDIFELQCVINNDPYNGFILKALLEQLKKLKGE